MRCNIILPAFLTDQHLIAERRELRMILPLLEKRSVTRNSVVGKIPKNYTLGKGHVKFFTNKLLFLFDRYMELTSECKKRGFNVKNIWPYEARYLVSSCMNETTGRDRYAPSELDFVINRARINKRWPKQARYYGKPYHYMD